VALARLGYLEKALMYFNTAIEMRSEDIEFLYERALLFI
jgi:hypothetical protein